MAYTTACGLNSLLYFTHGKKKQDLNPIQIACKNNVVMPIAFLNVAVPLYNILSHSKNYNSNINKSNLTNAK